MGNDKNSFEAAYNYAAAYCSKAEHCETDIENLFFRKGLSEHTKKVISRLKKEDFINCTRYANAFVKDKANLNGWGRIKIKNELLARRIPAELIENALSIIDDDKYQGRLEQTILSKAVSLKGKPLDEVRAKCLRNAVSKGFEYDKAKKVFEELEQREAFPINNEENNNDYDY